MWHVSEVLGPGGQDKFTHRRVARRLGDAKIWHNEGRLQVL